MTLLMRDPEKEELPLTKATLGGGLRTWLLGPIWHWVYLVSTKHKNDPAKKFIKLEFIKCNASLQKGALIFGSLLKKAFAS